MKVWTRIPILAALLSLPLAAVGADGMVTTQSNHSVAMTADKLVSTLKSKGMTVMNRINHTEGASKVGLELRPTEVVIFGNPKVGTPLITGHRWAQSRGEGCRPGRPYRRRRPY